MHGCMDICVARLPTYRPLVAVFEQRIEGVGLLQLLLFGQVEAGLLEALLENGLELDFGSDGILGPLAQGAEDEALSALEKEKEKNTY